MRRMIMTWIIKWMENDWDCYGDYKEKAHKWNINWLPMNDAGWVRHYIKILHTESTCKELF